MDLARAKSEALVNNTMSYKIKKSTTMPFCTTKTSNFLVKHYFHGGIVYVLTKDFVSCVYVRFFMFTAAHFHLAGR